MEFKEKNILRFTDLWPTNQKAGFWIWDLWLVCQLQIYGGNHVASFITCKDSSSLVQLFSSWNIREYGVGSTKKYSRRITLIKKLKNSSFSYQFTQAGFGFFIQNGRGYFLWDRHILSSIKAKCNSWNPAEMASHNPTYLKKEYTNYI